MSDDLISRQAAVDMLMERASNLRGTVGDLGGACSGAAKLIAQLPPAEPQIIRCKDCKHWDGVDTCDVIDAPVWDNDFCSMAERRSDE